MQMGIYLARTDSALSSKSTAIEAHSSWRSGELERLSTRARPTRRRVYVIGMASYTSALPPLANTGQPLVSSVAAARLSAFTIE